MGKPHAGGSSRTAPLKHSGLEEHPGKVWRHPGRADGVCRIVCRQRGRRKPCWGRGGPIDHHRLSQEGQAKQISEGLLCISNLIFIPLASGHNCAFFHFFSFKIGNFVFKGNPTQRIGLDDHWRSLPAENIVFWRTGQLFGDSISQQQSEDCVLAEYCQVKKGIWFLKAEPKDRQPLPVIWKKST